MVGQGGAGVLGGVVGCAAGTGGAEFLGAGNKANGGAAGVDHQKFEDIEVYGEERWLDELGQELKHRTYQPLPVRRVYIPKADGKTQRPLGIPAIRDRVVQMAAVLGEVSGIFARNMFCRCSSFQYSPNNPVVDAPSSRIGETG